MLTPIYRKQFEKDIKKAKKRGFNVNKLKTLIVNLLEEKQLPVKNRNHKLQGDFEGYWECHIEPDWLLIYKKTPEAIILARTGTHSDLFK
jgi:addiction module toxin, RelE/StbE family